MKDTRSLQRANEQYELHRNDDCIMICLGKVLIECFYEHRLDTDMASLFNAKSEVDWMQWKTGFVMMSRRLNLCQRSHLTQSHCHGYDDPVTLASPL
jgi:hypothetical protein